MHVLFHVDKELSCDPNPQVQEHDPVICTVGFTAAAINSALSPYLEVGFLISSLPWETRQHGWWIDCVSGWLGKLFVSPAFRVCCTGPWAEPGGALKMGNLSSCHVFHTVLIYTCLRAERKVFCLSNHLLCTLLLLSLFSLVTMVKVCPPLSIVHWVNWVLLTPCLSAKRVLRVCSITRK